MKPEKLDATKPQNVTYVIPLWLRDEQIKSNIANVSGRIQPQIKRDDPVAIVGFGPSLNQTWEKIKEFKYVISCSGAHKFLIERGIIPNWHVAVDPLPGNTVKLIGQPHKDVEYLIASTCNPDVIKHLKGYNIKLWHVFDTQEEGFRILPPEEWAITGGCDVGLRSITIASFLGFRDLHVFGIDGSAPSADAQRHAGEHPNSKPKYATTEYKGKTYYTTMAMLEAARQVTHELNQLPGVRATFYGEGLVQDMTKDYDYSIQKKPSSNPMENLIAFAKRELISDEYRRLNSQLHKENLVYGVGGGKHADIVLKLAESIKTKSILDYGCGKGYLAKAIPFPIWEYDPAIPGKEEAPRPADLVVCTDVLEHIEPDKIDYVLADLSRLTKQIGYFTIHTGAASKTLPDGRNTHLIQKDKPWWESKLKMFFDVGTIIQKGPELHCVVAPKGKQ